MLRVDFDLMILICLIIVITTLYFIDDNTFFNFSYTEPYTNSILCTVSVYMYVHIHVCIYMLYMHM